MGGKTGRPRGPASVDRLVFPAAESLNVFQAVTYLKTGEVPPADQLVELFRTAGGQRIPEATWTALESGAQALLDHARAGRIALFGRRARNDPVEIVPSTDLHGSLWLHVLENQLTPDVILDFGCDAAPLFDVCFSRSELAGLRYGPVENMARKVHDAAMLILQTGEVEPVRGCLAEVVRRLELDPAFANAQRNTLERYARPAVADFRSRCSPDTGRRVPKSRTE